MTSPLPLDARRAALLQRIRAEYREMPDLGLTAAQAARLCGMAERDCVAVLDALVAEGALRRTRDGRFVAGPRLAAAPSPESDPRA